MLQEMRKYTKSWIANIFLGALTLSFVSWGIGDILHGSSSTSVATVGGTEIDQTFFQRDYTNTIRTEGEQRGKPITTDEARKLDLGNVVLQQDISNTALDNAARKLGLTASDALVAREIQIIPAFAGLTGAFDRRVFEQRITQFGYNEQGFIELVRQETIRNQLVHAATGGFELPSGYARALFAYLAELRAAEYIVVDAKALGPIPAPSDAVLEAYMKAHPDAFSTPEYRDVTYAAITPDDVASQIKISDDEIKKVYDNNKDRFIIPEKRDLDQINFPNQAEAAAARAKIEAGTSFDQLATSMDKKPDDINLGELVPEDIEPNVGADQAKAIFALPQGGVSQPMKTTSGSWALIRVSKIVPGKITTLEQAADQIRKNLTLEMAQSKLTDIANAYTDASSGGLNLTSAAAKAGMHSGHIPAMDKNGLAPDGSKVGPDDPDFRKQVFAAETGEEGDPQPAKSGAYYVVLVNGVVPPKLKPLDQVRPQVMAAWTAQQQVILLRQKAENLAAMANKQGSIDAAAKSIGATVQASPAINRSTSDGTFSSQLVSALFAALPGQTVFGPQGKGDGYVIARVTGIEHPMPSPYDPTYLQAVRSISTSVGSSVSDSFIAALRADQHVTINYKLFNSVVGGNEGP
jgi:peptidyl-prolyl cis-trans isomerase D